MDRVNSGSNMSQIILRFLPHFEFSLLDSISQAHQDLARERLRRKEWQRNLERAAVFEREHVIRGRDSRLCLRGYWQNRGTRVTHRRHILIMIAGRDVARSIVGSADVPDPNDLRGPRRNFLRGLFSFSLCSFFRPLRPFCRRCPSLMVKLT